MRSSKQPASKAKKAEQVGKNVNAESLRRSVGRMQCLFIQNIPFVRSVIALYLPLFCFAGARICAGV